MPCGWIPIEVKVTAQHLLHQGHLGRGAGSVQIPWVDKKTEGHHVPTNQNPVTTGDRRRRHRFPLDMEVLFQFAELDQRYPAQFTGKVENISSSGLAFRTDEPPEPGSHLAVSIAWPAKRDDSRLRFVFDGIVLRASGGLVVVTILRPEFRFARKEHHGRP